MVRRVKVGDEFKVEAQLVDAFTRKLIALIVVLSSAFFLIGATIYGFAVGHFDHLIAVWSAVGPIYGGIAGYFFKKRCSSYS